MIFVVVDRRLDRQDRRQIIAFEKREILCPQLSRFLSECVGFKNCVNGQSETGTVQGATQTLTNKGGKDKTKPGKLKVKQITDRTIHRHTKRRRDRDLLT